MMAQSAKTKNVCLPKRHVIGIKYQMKTTNVRKHIGLLPQDVCIIYDLAFEYKMHTNEIITLHIYIYIYIFKHQSYSRKARNCNTNLKNDLPLKVGQLPKEQCIIKKYDFRMSMHKNWIIAFPNSRKHKTNFKQSNKVSKRYKEDK